MLGVVVTLIERGVQSVEVGLGSKCDGVAKEREVEVGVEVNFQLSEVFACQPSLCHQ